MLTTLPGSDRRTGGRLRATHVPLPAVGAVVAVIAILFAVAGWRLPEAGEFGGHWWTPVAAVPGFAWSLLSFGVLLCLAGGLVAVVDRAHVAADRQRRSSPLLRGSAAVIVVMCVWGIGAMRGESGVTSFVSDPRASSSSASAEVRRVVLQNELAGAITHRSVEVESVSAVGPFALVTVRVKEQNAAGTGTATDLSVLTDPVLGGLQAAWYFGLG